ncbi:hypothetical protein LSTR_LSTR015071 [Laodelphax striatellus]|uniref:Uncharacterized protein n=1 Tax=Laodelphax striatellus TaxID=195883 RepID=A0A482WM59_LAOST|nr:hypothetical protein LSTR_LSTR015071 [Laodelphax striatellus]
MFCFFLPPPTSTIIASPGFVQLPSSPSATILQGRTLASQDAQHQPPSNNIAKAEPFCLPGCTAHHRPPNILQGRKALAFQDAQHRTSPLSTKYCKAEALASQDAHRHLTLQQYCKGGALAFQESHHHPPPSQQYCKGEDPWPPRMHTATSPPPNNIAKGVALASQEAHLPPHPSQHIARAEPLPSKSAHHTSPLTQHYCKGKSPFAPAGCSSGQPPSTK